ncbi:MAG: CBS domain-containing protein [Halodesulfurarchaeum sp.]|nr:CBS domain-containing protein [Halodesulfurarchaeum sp.]
MSPLPVRDILSGDYLGVSESDAVLGAAALMRKSGETAAVVLRGQDAAGILTAGEILDHLVDGGDVESTPVSTVMNRDPPVVTPETTLGEATRLLVGTGRSHVLVEDGTEILGVLDARDLAAAKQPGRTEASTGGMQSASMVDSRDTAVDDGYSNQSICEGCGSFSQDLVNVDGQLLCPDCRTV